MPNISDARVLILAAEGFEQSELTVPRDELRRAGAQVEIASPEGGAIRGWKINDWGETLETDLKIGEANPSDYDALVLPGGQINPDLLRINQEAMTIIRTFLDSGKPVAAICHAPWLLIEAKAVNGREITSYTSIRTDIENAGGRWVDKEVVASDGIVTSRSPDDLPAFTSKIIEEIEIGRRDRSSVA